MVKTIYLNFDLQKEDELKAYSFFENLGKAKKKFIMVLLVKHGFVSLLERKEKKADVVKADALRVEVREQRTENEFYCSGCRKAFDKITNLQSKWDRTIRKFSDKDGGNAERNSRRKELYCEVSRETVSGRESGRKRFFKDYEGRGTSQDNYIHSIASVGRQ